MNILSLPEVRQLAVDACPRDGVDRFIIRELYSAFSWYDALHFGGRLPTPFISLYDGKLLTEYGRIFTICSIPGVKYHIQLDRSLLAGPENPLRFMRSCLLHECLHLLGMAYFSTNEEKEFCHGFWFAQQACRIGAYYGWKRVRSHRSYQKKRNRKIADCSHWPHCVQDEQYRRELKAITDKARSSISRTPATSGLPFIDTLKKAIEGVEFYQRQLFNDPDKAVLRIRHLRHIVNLINSIAPSVKLDIDFRKSLRPVIDDDARIKMEIEQLITGTTQAGPGHEGSTYVA
jgi:hypothetical protein